MASTNSENKKRHEAAAKALDDAETYFKLQKLDSAIKVAMQAKSLDPNLANVDNFITEYKIHRAVSSRKNWYVVLGIPECTHSLTISKRYKELALVVHPDKNVSAAVEGAFKHVNPVRKHDYDKSLMSKKKASAAIAARRAADVRNAAAAAARSEINEGKRRPDINLMMKYSRYVESKLTVW